MEEKSKGDRQEEREEITGPGKARENKGCLSTPQFLSLVTPFILSVSVLRATGLKYLKDNQTLRRTRMQTAISCRAPCPFRALPLNQARENINVKHRRKKIKYLDGRML